MYVCTYVRICTVAVPGHLKSAEVTERSYALLKEEQETKKKEIRNRKWKCGKEIMCF